MPKSKVRKSAKKKKRRPFLNPRDKQKIPKCWKCGCLLDGSCDVTWLSLRNGNTIVYLCENCARSIKDSHVKERMKKAVAAIN